MWGLTSDSMHLLHLSSLKNLAWFLCALPSPPPGVPAPTNILFSGVTPTSFRMSWVAPLQRPGLTGYHVVVRPKVKSGPNVVLNLAPDTTQALVPGLMVRSPLSRGAAANSGGGGGVFLLVPQWGGVIQWSTDFSSFLRAR